jgi:MerR family transcriptional regulator, thiopeptide resistance regulator
MTFDDLTDGAFLDISEVARIAGVSSRTLRHYDEVGLLRPAATRADGRRMYGREELLRLQRILLMRGLGLGLERIRDVLDDDADEVAALGEHLAALEQERGRLDDVIATVRRTLDHLTKGTIVSTEDVFAGLPGYDMDQQKKHEQEARERWGDDAVDASKQRTASLSREGASEVMADHEHIARDLAALHQQGVAASDERVQVIVARHHAWVSTFWVPDAEAYQGLGQMYVDDERFRATYDAFGEGTAAYLRDAIQVYAST